MTTRGCARALRGQSGSSERHHRRGPGGGQRRAAARRHPAGIRHGPPPGAEGRPRDTRARLRTSGEPAPENAARRRDDLNTRAGAGAAPRGLGSTPSSARGPEPWYRERGPGDRPFHGQWPPPAPRDQQPSEQLPTLAGCCRVHLPGCPGPGSQGLKGAHAGPMRTRTVVTDSGALLSQVARTVRRAA